MDRLQARLQPGARPLLLDGALGTQLESQGIPMPAPLWSAAALRSHPGMVQALHTAYLHAGAEVITTNTFRTHARTVGNAADARALTAQAVALANAARAQTNPAAWVAGSVAPLEDCYRPDLTPGPATCAHEHAQHIAHLAEAGVDLLLIETMNTAHEAAAAAQAAQAHHLPFFVSFVLQDTTHILSGETLRAAVETVAPYAPWAVLVNCIPARHIVAALAHLRTLTALPIGAYGNMDTPADVAGWAAAPRQAATDYCHTAREWLAVGAQIIGSCCGSSPAHTRALADHLHNPATPDR
ncbi:MAG: homocysteine S-methyltransferase family protein [Anaerolineales bacterium]